MSSDANFDSTSASASGAASGGRSDETSRDAESTDSGGRSSEAGESTEATVEKTALLSESRFFVVPFDFSAHAEAALEAAVDLARRLEANLHLVHVIQLPAYAYGYGGVGGAYVASPRVDAGIREDAALSLRWVVDRIQDFPGQISAEVIEGSNVAETIAETARKIGADLVVMGTHGRTGLAHVFLGSVAERTLRSAPCPVLTIRCPDGEPDAA